MSAAEGDGDPCSALLPAALLGCERQIPAPPAWPGAAGRLAAAIADGEGKQATRLLRLAGTIAVCANASGRGEPAPAHDAGMAAETESVPALADTGAIASVNWLLRNGQDAPPRLLTEALLHLSSSGWRLPPHLLPAALDAGRRNVALRPALLPVLGLRGPWLARRNPDWRYVGSDSPDDQECWSNGSLLQRVAWLRTQRRADAATARERLAATLPELPAGERSTFVAALATGLAPEDEPLLHALLGDRSREVRRTALDLLVVLPDSDHCRRAIERIKRCLTGPAASSPTPPQSRTGRVLAQVSKALGGGGGSESGDRTLKAAWTLDAPDAADPDWKSDGIDIARPKNESLGERGWWLYQLVRQVPLNWWTRHTGATPRGLLQWAAKSEWAEALARGWHDVLLARSRDEAPQEDERVTTETWTLAFLNHGRFAQRWLGDTTGSLLALLPQTEREPFWIDRLRDGARTRPAVLAHLIEEIAAACSPGECVSAELGTLLLRGLVNQLEHGRLDHEYGVRAQLSQLACLLPPALLTEMLALPRRADETPSLSAALDQCTRCAQARQVILGIYAAEAVRTATAPSSLSPPVTKLA